MIFLSCRFFFCCSFNVKVLTFDLAISTAALAWRLAAAYCVGSIWNKASPLRTVAPSSTHSFTIKPDTCGRTSISWIPLIVAGYEVDCWLAVECTAITVNSSSPNFIPLWPPPQLLNTVIAAIIIAVRLNEMHFILFTVIFITNIIELYLFSKRSWTYQKTF